jgi:ABC-type glutathione transport system ATPase component
VSATATDTTIRLQALTKSFASPTGPVRAVRGIDVEIRAGGTVALLGPNGAGKSTTIDMLIGLLPPGSGAVTVFGRPPSDAIAEGRLGMPARHTARVNKRGLTPFIQRVTRLTSLPGTTISFTTVVPSRWRTTFGSARASARTASRSRSTGALNWPRSFPFTCTA